MTPSLDAETFKAVFRGHPAGVCVITFDGPTAPAGFTATSVISVSADPALLAFSIDASSSNWPALSAARTLVVNFLAADQANVSARFASRVLDRFAGGGWHRLPSGEPAIDHTAAWIRAEVLSITAAGTSRLVVLGALQAEIDPTSSPLLYHDRTYVRMPTEADRRTIAELAREIRSEATPQPRADTRPDAGNDTGPDAANDTGPDAPNDDAGTHG